MATRLFIAQKLPSGSFRAIYCHWDGHTKTAGLTLHNHYSSTERVEALLALGSLSELNSWLAGCVANHRDKGEAYAPPTKYDDLADLQEACRDAGGEFLYIWDGSAWTVNGEDLASALAGLGLIEAPPAPAPGPDWAALGPRLAQALRGIEGLLYEAHSDIPEGMRAKRDVWAALEIARANILPQA